MSKAHHLTVPKTPRKYRDSWYRHRKKWQCQKILGRGTCPCTILFVTDDPSEAELFVGKSLVGSEGRIFKHLLEKVDLNLKGTLPAYAVAPYVPGPTRFQEFAILTETKAFVTLGKFVTEQIKWVTEVNKSKQSILQLKHPSLLLGSGKETEKAQFVHHLTAWIRKEKPKWQRKQKV